MFGAPSTDLTRPAQIVAPTPQTVDTYRVYPRIVAFRNAPKSTMLAVGQSFWTSLKVYDTTIQPGDMSDSTYILQRDSLAQAFLDIALRRFVVDSLKLELNPGAVQITVVPDSAKHTPRDVNYFSYNFGQITIDRNFNALRAVFFYRLYDTGGAVVSADTVAFPLVRIERDQMLVSDMLEDDNGTGFRGN